MLPVSRATPGRFSVDWPTLLLAFVGLVALAISLQYSDDALCVVLNFGLFACPLWLVLLSFGRARLAVAVASAFVLLIWGIGELKMHFFGERLGLMDLYFLSEGANWSIVERYPNIQWAVAGWLAISAALAVACVRVERGRRAWGLRARSVCVCLLAAWCAVAWTGRHHHTWEVYREDADCGADSICGVMSRLIYSYSAFEMLHPMPTTVPTRFLAAAGGLPELQAQQGGAPNALPQTVNGKTYPDVIVWLHESTFDPSQYRMDGAQLPAFTMFQRTPQTQASGFLRVHTFGGRTWLSEFSLLTSLVPNDFGARSSMVFNSVAPEVSSTLVGRFLAAGYDCVALMPTPREFYGAARTYTAVGFQRVLTLRDFPEYNDVPGDEWDIADSDRLAEAATTLLREHHQRAPDRPLFLYLLSIKEHSPYSADTEPAYGLAGGGRTEVLAARMTDYVGRLRKLDNATVDLERTLIAAKRPTLWAYFGDHQANFEEPSPPYRYKLTEPDLVTQYQLRANFALPNTQSSALLDIALLPSLIADAAGLPADSYFAAQSAMRRLCDGRLADCPDRALVDSYKGYIFGAKMALLEARVPVVAVQAP